MRRFAVGLVATLALACGRETGDVADTTPFDGGVEVVDALDEADVAPVDAAADDSIDAGPPTSCTPPARTGTDCTSDGKWCQVLPTNGSPKIVSLSAVAPDDAWGVAKGTILHWNGDAWTPVAHGLDASTELVSVWASRADDVWIGSADGIVLRWDCRSLRPFSPSPALHGVRTIAGTAADDVWILGIDDSGHSTIRRWNGSTWSDVPGPAGWTSALWVGGPSDAWALSDARSAPLHWDGSTWSDVSLSSPAAVVSALWGRASDDVWLVGAARTGEDSQQILHWDGSGLADRSPSLSFVGSFQGFYGAAANDVWAVGGITIGSGIGGAGVLEHWDGTSWSASTLDRTPSLQAVVGTSAHDVWALTSTNAILHGDGVSWTRSTLGAPLDYVGGIGGSSTSDVWIASVDGAIHFDGTGWSRFETGMWTTASLSVRASDDAWVVGYDYPNPAIAHWDGVRWVKQDAGLTRADVLYGTFARARDDAWIVGYEGSGPLVLHWDGASLTRTSVSAPIYPYAVWAAAADDAWMVGTDETMMHWDGSSWSAVPQAAKYLKTIWGTSANDVWAIGVDDKSTPIALHWDGVTWTTTILPAGAGVWTAMSGSGPDDAWAVGGDGSTGAQVAHWDGSSWSIEGRREMGNSATGVWVPARGDAWAFGDSGILFRRSK